jgi:hypothetical protein
MHFLKMGCKLKDGSNPSSSVKNNITIIFYSSKEICKNLLIPLKKRLKKNKALILKLYSLFWD